MYQISEAITKDTIARFSVRIGYNLSTYLDLYSYFIEYNQPNITKYFENQNVVPDAASFDFLAKMIEESSKIDNLVSINSNKFDRYDDWELLDFLETIKTSLKTVDNTDKYTRSSKTKNSWRTTGVATDYMLTTKETLEEVVEEQLGSKNPDNEWQGLAISNNLLEKDYGSENVLIIIQKGINFSRFLYLDSVVDNLVGENLYGKDLPNYIQFDSVENDLAVLTPQDTFLQSVTTLVTLKKEDIPQYPDMGLTPTLFAGSNINVFEYGLMVRQLTETVGTDDTIRNFALLDIKYHNTSMFIKYVVDSFYNLNKTLTNKI